jgi:polysaccharide biosynthesis/export protein
MRLIREPHILCSVETPTMYKPDFRGPVNARPMRLFRLTLMPVVMSCALLCGCVSPQPATPVQTSAGANPAMGSVSFSDEISRDLVRQTRRLLALRERDYLIGPDDVLEISIFEWEMSQQTKTLEFRVAESGVVSLPAVGVVPVAGKTVQEAQKIVEENLSSRNVLQNPRVSVTVKEFRSRRIAVIGQVNAPGVYAIHENVSTLMDMLTLAGGPNVSASQYAFVLRAKTDEAQPLRIVVDLEELFDKGAFDQNPVLQGGDTVYVPQAPLIYVYGYVRQPGGFALHRSLRVLEAVALAGGIAPKADKWGSYLIRRTKGQTETIMPLNLTSIERGEAPNIFLREGDVLHVPGSVGKTIVGEIWDVFRGIFTFTYRLDSNN